MASRLENQIARAFVLCLLGTLLYHSAGCTWVGTGARNERLLDTRLRNPVRAVSGEVRRGDDGLFVLLSETCRADEAELWGVYETQERELTGGGWAALALGAVAGAVGMGLLVAEMTDHPEWSVRLQEWTNLNTLKGAFTGATTGLAIWVGGLAVAFSGQSEDEVSREWRSVRQVRCEANTLRSLEGRNCDLSTGRGWFLADVRITNQGFPFPLGQLSRVEASTSEHFDLMCPLVDTVVRIEVTDQIAFRTVWERHASSRPPPNLDIQLSFNDFAGDNDGILDPEEEAGVSVVVTNEGPGWAYGVAIDVDNSTVPIWLDVETVGHVGDLEPTAMHVLEIPVRSNRQAEVAEVQLRVVAREEGGFDSAPVRLVLNTDRFHDTSLSIGGLSISEITGDADGVFEPNEVVGFHLPVRNHGDLSAETQVQLSSVSAGSLQGADAETILLEPGEEGWFDYRFVLPMRDAEDVDFVELEFVVTDQRTGNTQTHNAAVRVGSVTERIVRRDNSVRPSYPLQRVFIGTPSEEVSRLIGDSLATLRESLLSEGNIALQNDRETNVYLRQCFEQSEMTPALREQCELRLAQTQTFDWLLRLDVLRSQDEYDLVLEVIDPHTSATRWQSSQTVQSSDEPDGAMRSMSRSFHRWLSSEFY